jgi:hypothetical protein
MIRIKLLRLTDGRILVTLTVAHITVLTTMVHLTDSEAVTLEVRDE